MRNGRRLALLVGAVVLVGASTFSAAEAQEPDPTVSPAECGVADTPETGIQGDIPRADQESGRADQGYNCGLSLISEVGVSGAVQGYDHCAYVRGDGVVTVIDVTDPVAPNVVGEVPVLDRTETMRVVAAEDRAVLVSGTSAYEISDCDDPVLKGEIDWPGVLPWPAGLNHDIRVTQDGKKVWAGLGVVEADITDLDDPSSWTVVNHTCDVAAQYHPLHSVPAAAEAGLCDTPWQDWPPQLTHGPDLNDDGTRLYVGNQSILASWWTEDTRLRIIDVTQDPPKIIGEIDGPGHSVDWFRSADGREFVLHANEIVTAPATSCVPHPRPSSLGWAHEAFITEVTDDTAPKQTSMLELAINKPENCEAKLDSQQNTQVAYHAIDDPNDATFAMVSMGDAGLRVFDIRNPEAPKEAAYFNRGPLVHAGVGHYDTDRGLVLMPGADAFRVLELQPQVIDELGLPYPTDPAYPRYPNGRAATP